MRVVPGFQPSSRRLLIRLLEASARKRKEDMKSVLVTGGAGYIGSQTAKALARAGYDPVVFDNLSLGHRWAVQWGPLIEADVSDRQAVRRCLATYDIEAVIHCAANAYVGESVTAPRKYYQNNVSNTLTLLDELLEAGVRTIVFSSSCATYGKPLTPVISEDHPQEPLSPYGESKLFIERVLRSYDRAYGLRSVSLRYFNAAGADVDGHLGEDHDPETHLIPLAINAALGLAPPLDVLGADYPTVDGTAVRDYIHVGDLANAHVSALTHLLAGGATAAMNLGTGRGYSVKEIIAAVERISGRSVPHRFRPRREGDAPLLAADTARARKILGWAPEWSDIHGIIGTAWAWHSRQSARALEKRTR